MIGAAGVAGLASDLRHVPGVGRVSVTCDDSKTRVTAIIEAGDDESRAAARAVCRRYAQSFCVVVCGSFRSPTAFDEARS